MSSNIILPGDPDFEKPVVMGNAYSKTPKAQSKLRAEENDRQREKANPGGFKYANTQIAHVPDPWYKQAQQAGISNIMTQPMWFSPLHTPQNWQIASKRREVYQWCHHPNTDILMWNGILQPISKIRVGDFVISHTGQKRRVKNIGRRWINENVYKIYYSGIKNPLITTGNHKLFAISRNEVERVANIIDSRKGHLGLHKYKEQISQNVKWIETKSLLPSDLVFTPKINRSIKLINSNIEWTEGICEILGIYAAEGDICWYKYKNTKRPKGIRLTISSKEPIFLETIRRLMKNEFDKEVKIYQKNGSVSVHIYNKEIGQFCLEHIGHGVYKKQLSMQLKSLPDQYIKAFLKGYISGDGSISKDDGKITVVTASKFLAQDVIYLSMSLGIPFRYEFGITSSKFSDKVHYVIVFPRNIFKLGIYKFSSIKEEDIDKVYTKYPNRIHKSWFSIDINKNKNTSRRIRKIDITPYAGYVYNIEVEEDHSYIANYISVSNCRFWYENEPKVAAAIDFYSRFPMNGFSLECPNRKVLSFYEHHIIKKLHLNERLKEISSEYYMLGDVFIHTDIKCDICSGIGIDPNTQETCNHPGGGFKRIFIMNPDWIEVQKSPLTDEPLIVLIPDDELQQIVHKRSPKPIYDRIPDHLKPLIIAKAPIPMSNRTLSHIKHMSVPYGTYGTSIIRRLFTTLAYKTKIMTANWIVAERLILPVRVVKIGSDDRPASTTDIADVQTQLGQVANDPNLTIVTHHNFEYEWYGTSGKVLQITKEMEHIDKELLDGLMLNQALLNGEMSGYQCHDAETEVLTDSGFKKYKNVRIDDKIACFNVYTNQVNYEIPLDKYEYDYDGELIHFNNKRIDIMVTPNHQMLVSKNKKEWTTVEAHNINPGIYFRGIVNNFVSFIEYPVISINNEFVVEVGNNILVLDNFVKLAGYYLSEGTISNRKSSHNLRIYQSKKKRLSYANISQTFKRLEYNSHVYNYRNDEYQFVITSKGFTEFMLKHFGHGASNKFIPKWIKCLPEQYLETFIKAICEGDGHRRKTNCVSWLYSSTSETMINDLQEIAFACGYSTRKYNSGTTGLGNMDLFRLHLSKGEKSNGSYPFIKKHHINKILYKGKVWCFTTSTGFFVTRRNGKIAIHGNSAQVGVETLIRRIESWRHSLAEWSQERVFKPIAEMQGFVNEKKSEEVGETVFLYPSIKWNDLELKDKTQYHQMLMQLHDKQVISTQTLLEEIDLDYDQEVKRMRYEQAQMGPMGAQMGQPGAGMGMGGMGGMGGDMGAGGSGGTDSMPGMGMEPIGGGLGGGLDTGSQVSGPASVADVSGKITKKGKNKEKKDEIIPMIPIKLTKIEQKMAGVLEKVANTVGFPISNIRMQYPVENPKGGKAFSMDFAIPAIKMDVECDGEVWHSSEDQKTNDQERDYTLAQRGWTVLRFDDKAIEESTQQVSATINSYIIKAIKARSKNKEASVQGIKDYIGYFVNISGRLKNLGSDIDRYYNYLSQTYPTIHKSEDFHQ